MIDYEVLTPDQLIEEQKQSFERRVAKLVEYCLCELKVQRDCGVLIGEVASFDKDTLVLEAAMKKFQEQGWQVKLHQRLFRSGGPRLMFYKL
jgi:hypothetical protein